MKKIKTCLIIGFGEIGKAINQIEEDASNKTYVCDIGKEPENIMVDVAHICIPFSKNFIDDVIHYINKYEPKLVIVHSTIKTNTIQEIKKRTNVNIVHSPCMGIHPYLYEGIKTFIKIISGDTESCIIAQNHFSDIGIKSHIFKKENAGELAKLLDTTYYSWNMIFAKYVSEKCKKYDCSFEEVYEMTNSIYNEGYGKLGKNNVIRPILYPPSKEGLGGHCCIENAILLHEDDEEDFIAKEILKLGKNSDLKYKDRTWLYCEYVGKEKTIKEIGDECSISATTISNYLNKYNIPKRNQCWTEEEDALLEELSAEMTFKEISKTGLINKTYEAIRIRASNRNIESPYNPGYRNYRTRKKISCTLRGIEEKDFKKFTLTENDRLRHSLKYGEWRENVFKRDNWVCQNPECEYCGNKQGTYLNAHHIIYWKDDEDLRFTLDNGITYCQNYHKYLHGLL